MHDSCKHVDLRLPPISVGIKHHHHSGCNLVLIFRDIHKPPVCYKASTKNTATTLDINNHKYILNIHIYRYDYTVAAYLHVYIYLYTHCHYIYVTCNSALFNNPNSSYVCIL